MEEEGKQDGVTHPQLKEVGEAGWISLGSLDQRQGLLK